MDASRRTPVARFAPLAVAAALFASSACREPPPPRYACPGCNIVLISLDTLRADHVGAYGYERPTTPHIDELAARGVLFADAISQSSWTRPAHMSMLTGLYPVEHGFVALADRKRLVDDVPTLAGVLAENGYATAAFTGGVNMSPIFGFDQGFDLYRVNGRDYRASLEETKYWLDEVADDKFFLFFHGYDAHTPYRSDPVDRAALGLDDAPPSGGFRRVCKAGKIRRLQRYVAEYDAAIRRGDRYIGKLLAHIDGLGLGDRTVVVFTSDHGEEFLEHGRCFHVSTLHDEVLRVPLVVAGPGTETRRVVGVVPASVAVAPTILDIAGIAEHAIPGPSLAPILAGSEPRFGVVHSETFRRIDTGRGDGHVRALTGDAEKFIEWVTKQESAYFDLRNDPDEQQPILDGPDLERMKRKLELWQAAHPPRAVQQSLAEGVGEKLEGELRALGYSD